MQQECRRTTVRGPATFQQAAAARAVLAAKPEGDGKKGGKREGNPKGDNNKKGKKNLNRCQKK